MNANLRDRAGTFIVLLVATLVATPPVEAVSLFSYKWHSIGPAPICCWFGGGETGRATAIAINPTNAEDVWVGTAGGGVWHSADAGQSWTPMSDDQPSLAIGSLALAECTHDDGCARIYAGTGENAIRRDTYYGAGLLYGVATSSGVNWTTVDGGPTYNFARGSIYNVVLDRTTSGSSQVIYITLSSGVTASASEATVTAPEPSPGGYGIYKSSDNGATWTKLKVADNGSSGVNDRPTDLEIDRTNPNVLYAGFLGRGIFKSTDAGQNWCPLNSGIPKPLGCPATKGLPKPAVINFDHVEIDIYRGDHNHLYATLGRCPDRLVNDCEPFVFESTDGGLNWTTNYWGTDQPTTSQIDIPCPAGYTRYMHGLTISPTQPKVLFLGAFHLCQSMDGGGSWFRDDWNNSGDSILGFRLHPDHHAVVFHDVDTSWAYNVSDGGITVSTDGGDSWTPLVNGLSTVEFQSLAVSPNVVNVIGGTQDNAGVLWKGSKQWTHLPCCGDGGFSVMESSDKNKMYVTSNPVAGEHNVIPQRSSDGGKSFPRPFSQPVYDIGINTTEVRSYYPPMFQDFGGTVWFGTSRLWSSTNFITNFSSQSPVLSGVFEDEIVSRQDVITAVAEAPSLSSRMYVGYYSGKVFVSYAPCSSPACWTLRSNGLPGAPVTWLAVDPSDANIVYATVSGFGSGVHAYRTDNAGLSWNPTGSTSDLNGVPANAIAVALTPPNVVYMGTDNGIYKTENGGGAWYRFSNGLPNVPVYSIVIDAQRGRIFAATHGRGAYTLSSSFMNGYGLFDRGLVTAWSMYGGGFGAGQSCVISIVRQDGSVCASSATDVLGGTIHTDGGGFLTSTKPGFFSDLPVVWACAHGDCLGQTAKECNTAGNPIASIRAKCGDQAVTNEVHLAPPSPDPPSALLTIGFPQAGAGSGGSFALLPAVQSGDGSSRVLCSVDVSFSNAETVASVLEHATDSIAGDPTCAAMGVSAKLIDAQDGDRVEDLFAHPAYLRLQAPDVVGDALLPAVRFAPGSATGVCFNLKSVDDPLGGRMRGMAVSFSTGPSGAAGGSVTVTERSDLGQCSIVAPTAAGASAASVAASIAAAFQSPGIPGPASCPSFANARDVMGQGESIRTASADDLVVCVNDPGVGAAIAPEEICFNDFPCDDLNPCTLDLCALSSGRCTWTPRPDGTACEDADPCTVGAVCFAGGCGTPLNCNDGNPCSMDRCDRATGACVHETVACDDGNPCTVDTCGAATGGCVFTPTPGAVCSDGDPCTIGDSCVQAPGNAAPACEGQLKCADANPCTADLCDPATGACSYPPIVCDDGNPCTSDACLGGVCVASTLAGASCDDRDRCTTFDTCVAGTAGTPVCAGVPASCDDGNPCSVDACDSVTGGCTHALAMQQEVTALQFTTPVSMMWPAIAGATSYNTYRGSFPPTGFGVYDQACFEHGDSHADGPRVSTDPAVPAMGSGYYYLVSQVSACGEGPIGSDSNGTSIADTTPCP